LSNGVVPAGAIYTATLGNAVGDNGNVGIAINNSGDLTAVRGGIVAGTFGSALGAGSNAGSSIKNALYGIYTVTKGDANGAGNNAAVHIENSGSAFGGTSAGIYALSNSATTIVTAATPSRAGLWLPPQWRIGLPRIRTKQQTPEWRHNRRPIRYGVA
jgi:hypothetical protein